MKKFFSILMILAVVGLAACSNSSAATQTAAPVVATNAATQVAASDNSATSGELTADYTDAVSVEEQLILGTLSLDGTANAVTKDEAAALLTLWENLQSLSPQGGQGGPNGGGQGGPDNGGNPPSADANSTQAAPADNTQPQAMPTVDTTQTDAVLAQIEAAMTADQISAIAAMQITTTSAATIMEAKGISTDMQGGPQGNGNGGGPQGDGNATQNPPTDATPDGSMPGGGKGGNGMVQPGLLNALIQYLANVAGVEVPTSAAPAAPVGK
jgi:hypothetical protein